MHSTHRIKVGSLLSSCWQLRKTMPIHSLGTEAHSGLDGTLLVGFGRGPPSLTVNKKKQLHCKPQHELRDLQLKSERCMLHASQNYTSKQLNIKTCSIAGFTVTVSLCFYICEPGQSTGSQCVSQCWQHECEPPRTRGAAWNAASRTKTMETIAATMANHKNAAWVESRDTWDTQCKHAGQICFSKPSIKPSHYQLIFWLIQQTGCGGGKKTTTFHQVTTWPWDKTLQSSAEHVRQTKTRWHSLKRALMAMLWVSGSSAYKGKNKIPSSDASVIVSHITSRYERHASSMRGWQQAGSESDNLS